MPAGDALDAGRAQEAAATFAEALKAGPPTPPLLLGAALAAHLQTRYEDARQHLVAALGLDPSLLPASILLGEVLYASGDLDGAILVYEQALVKAPDHPQITKKVEAWRKELALHSRFGQRFSDHFTVLFEGPAEAPLAQHAVGVLEAACNWRIGTVLAPTRSTPITGRALHPRAVPRCDAVARMGRRGVRRTDSRAGAGALENPREFDRVLTHEFTHALIHSVAPRGVPDLADRGPRRRVRRLEPGEAGRNGCAARRRRCRSSGSTGSFAKLTPGQATLAYAQSAVAAEALIDQAGTTAVVSLLADIGTGTSFAAAFAKNIPIGLAEFQKKLWGDTP